VTKEEKKAYDYVYYRQHAERRKAQAAAWRRAHPDRVKEFTRKSKEKHKPARKAYAQRRYLNRKEQQAAYTRFKKYGITHSEFLRMVAEQKGRCAICDRTTQQVGQVRALSVDHDHCTNKVRQLLCHECNSGLGMLQDNPDLLRKAATYIEAHRKKEAA